MAQLAAEVLAGMAEQGPAVAGNSRHRIRMPLQAPSMRTLSQAQTAESSKELPT